MKTRTPIIATVLLALAAVAIGQTIVNVYPDPVHAGPQDQVDATGHLTPAVVLRPHASVGDSAPVLVRVDTIATVSPHAWIQELPDADGDGQPEQSWLYTSRVVLDTGAIYYVDTEWHELAQQLIDLGWGRPLPTVPERWISPNDPAAQSP